MADIHGDWFDGEDIDIDDLVAMQPFLIAIVDPTLVGHCVVCRTEQPIDIGWPRYGVDLEHKDTGEATEYIFVVCPTCEPGMDNILKHLGGKV